MDSNIKLYADRDYTFQEIASIPASVRGLICNSIVCEDGFSFSVQASKVAFSHPKSNTEVPYTHFEIGFPSGIPTGAILEFAEDKSMPTLTVYPYVPKHLIEELILLHSHLINKLELLMESF